MSDDADDRVILTPEEAESLLRDKPTVHNYVVAPGMLIGCDFSWDAAIAAFKHATRIELAGENAKSTGHAIVVWEDDKSYEYSFFEADMEKVVALEEAKRLSSQ
jgi:hypothetical protein